MRTIQTVIIKTITQCELSKILVFYDILYYNKHMRPSEYPVIDQMHVQGRYEISPTDTAILAAELSAAQDTNKLLADFDYGVTPLRDVGKMFAAQRTTILEAYQEGTVHELADRYPDIFTAPVQNLHNRVVSGTQDQPVGHNFFVNATGFLDAQLPWANQFDELLRRRWYTSIYDIAQSNDNVGKDELLAAITYNPDTELATTIAVYLAGRSLEGEKYLMSQYGEILKQAKSDVFRATQNIGAATGLRDDMLERAAGQLQRATFGSFDHLDGLVTSQNTGAAGDYEIGSLRVEVQFDGNVRSPKLRSGLAAYHIIVHELNHAASAQTQEKNRCGLQANGQGLEANEGMTEYLAQLSIGSPGIGQLANGHSYVRQDVPYKSPVAAMLILHERFRTGKDNHFATLFNAYHGDVSNQTQLEEAIDTFYQYDITISNQSNR